MKLIRAASFPASFTASSWKPLAVSRPRALITAASQVDVPKGRLPRRIAGHVRARRAQAEAAEQAAGEHRAP